jgi:ATP-dependent protease ClpP protease subunit
MRKSRRNNSSDDSFDGCGSVLGKDLIFSGSVGDRLFVFLWENLLKAGTRLDDNPSIAKEGRRLFLNSTGGDTYAMVSIVDLLENLENISIVATGSCMSAAVPILASGTKGQRYATKRTRFMIHPASAPMDGYVEKDEMFAEAYDISVLHDHYAGIMEQNCKHNKAWWKAKLDSNHPWYFGVETAIRHGIIDKVLPF